jgi:phage-related minor tail protein
MTPFVQIPSVEEVRARRAAQEAERLRLRAEEDARLEKEYEEAMKKAEEEAKAQLERDRLEEIRQRKLAELEEEERRRSERRAEKRKRKEEEEEDEEDEEATETEGPVSTIFIFLIGSPIVRVEQPSLRKVREGQYSLSETGWASGERMREVLGNEEFVYLVEETGSGSQDTSAEEEEGEG